MARNSAFTVVTPQADAAAGTASRTFTVPDNKAWRLRSAYAVFVTLATLGNRVIEMQITDGSGNVYQAYQSAATHAASLTRSYLFAAAGITLAAFNSANQMTVAIAHDLVVPAGYKIKFYDRANIAAAEDTILVRMMIEEMDA